MAVSTSMPGFYEPTSSDDSLKLLCDRQLVLSLAISTALLPFFYGQGSDILFFYIIGADILRIKLLPNFNPLSSLIHTYHFLFAAITFTNLAIPSVQAIVMYRSPASVCTIRVNHLFPWQLSLGEIAHILLLDVEF